ncbi:hypothetical protein KP79_PYT26175 [Mizuhopecten yessoensis]|uniref:Uncharacterized protein n=1 Tax=Mizuhopecten yessoensis TaxID=6573 RepID=A0A210QFI3_MIZYE|nr:hypothetical protein KP79_PYT26175 [Mizuhopecten yessoensis]
MSYQKNLENTITKDYLNSIVAKLKDELQADIHRENEEIVHSLKGRINSLESENEDLREKVTILEQRVTDSEEFISDLGQQHNDLEQHGRKNSIRINGLPDHSERESVEDCVSMIVDFVNNRLKVPLRSDDIDIAHRLGRFDNTKKRSVIVKFTNRRKKHEIIKARRTLKGSGFTVFEDVTKANQQRLKEAYH